MQFLIKSVKSRKLLEEAKATLALPLFMLAAHSMTFYRVVSVGQVGFDGRSYYRRSCLMQEIACAKPFEN